VPGEVDSRIEKHASRRTAIVLERSMVVCSFGNARPSSSRANAPPRGAHPDAILPESVATAYPFVRRHCGAPSPRHDVRGMLGHSIRRVQPSPFHSIENVLWMAGLLL
jgi:hypothetical protein